MRNTYCVSNVLSCLLSALLIVAVTSLPVPAQDDYGMDMDMDMGMDMEMGGMGATRRPAPTPLERAVESLKNAQNDKQRKAALASTRQQLAAQYDAYLQQNAAELDQMEQRLENLRLQLKRRQDAKDELIDMELQRISNEAQGLVWPTGQSRNRSAVRPFARPADLLEPALEPGASVRGMSGQRGRRALSGGDSFAVSDQELEKLARTQWLARLKSGQSKMPLATAKIAKPPTPKEPRDNVTRTKDLRQIMIACLNYESAYSKFPSNLLSPEGKPLLSWRVLVLPFWGDDSHQNLYREFHLDEPWDSEHNKKLLKLMPAAFANVKNSDVKTSTMGFEFRGAMLEEGEDLGFANITDGSSNTIFCIDAAADLAVEWSKPDDISLAEFDSKNAPEQLFMNEDGAGRAAFCDGSSSTFDLKKIKPQLGNLINRQDGQVVDRNP